MKTRRMTRYQVLRDNGMLNFEAAVLSNIPLDVPYMKDLIHERQWLRRLARERNWTKEQYENQVKQQYIDNGFYKQSMVGQKAKLDVWMMLRSWEKRFKDKVPSYNSPWQKRRKSWVNFMEKEERTRARQNGILID